MAQFMKGLWLPISFVTIFLVVYTILAYTSGYGSAVMLMFVLSPFLVIWMVYRVLRDGKPSGRAFNDYFYDDVDYKRVKDSTDS
jgi:hypothetical protein